MTTKVSGTHRRLNITLLQETVRLIDRDAKKGDRNRFIVGAVEEIGGTNLRHDLQLVFSRLRRVFGFRLDIKTLT